MGSAVQSTKHYQGWKFYSQMTMMVSACQNPGNALITHHAMACTSLTTMTMEDLWSFSKTRNRNIANE